MSDNVYIITPTWNCGPEFNRCAMSVAYHTHVSAKWVIVENGSLPADKVAVMGALTTWLSSLKQVEEAKTIFNSENLGIPIALNQALDWIAENDEGPYHVVSLSADTEVEADWLRQMLQFADDYPQVGIIGGAKSPQGLSLPVYHDYNGRWYQHREMAGGIYQGESVDFSGVFLRWEILRQGLRFDTRYEIYDGYDQDLSFRVRSWEYKIVQIDAGIIHYGSATMKKQDYQWAGGGRREWDALRARNLARFVSIWAPFLAPRRSTIKQEIAHVEAMNRKLIEEAGDRKQVPILEN